LAFMSEGLSKGEAEARICRELGLKPLKVG